MTCPACAQWCATTEEQLATRLRNMGNGPEASPHPCPMCGDTDWISSRDMIREAPKRRTIWQRIWYPQVSTPVIVAVNIFTAVACLGLALITASRWSAMIDTFFAGAALAMAFFNVVHMKMRRAFDNASAAFDEMAQLNKALIHGKISHMMMIQPGDDDDAPPISPKNLN